MIKLLSFVEARKNLSMLVDEVAQNNTRFIIQKRGKDKVVVISAEDYLRSITPVDPIFAGLRSEVAQKGKDNISATEIEREIKVARKELAKHKTKNV